MKTRCFDNLKEKKKKVLRGRTNPDHPVLTPLINPIPTSTQPESTTWKCIKSSGVFFMSCRTFCFASKTIKRLNLLIWPTAHMLVTPALLRALMLGDAPEKKASSSYFFASWGKMCPAAAAPRCTPIQHVLAQCWAPQLLLTPERESGDPSSCRRLPCICSGSKWKVILGLGHLTPLAIVAFALYFK